MWVLVAFLGPTGKAGRFAVSGYYTSVCSVVALDDLGQDPWLQVWNSGTVRTMYGVRALGHKLRVSANLAQVLGC